MVLVLDSRIPSVWRTPRCLQFGVDEPALVLDEVTSADERMLVALSAGVTREGLQLVADRARADPGDAEALLDRLAPVLAAASAEPPQPRLVVLDGAGATAAALEGLLADAGVEVRSGLRWDDPAVERADAAVIVASYAVEPQRHARWLRRDVPHLPIVFGDGGVVVGPYVRPGRGPCLRCLDLHRTDADPAWPAMATQLHTRRAPGETAVAAAAAAARAAGVLLREVAGAGVGAGAGAPAGAGVGAAARAGATAGAAMRGGTAARLVIGGVDWVSREWAPHPACGCLGLPP
ncbi:TOMM precursor leader peptide-binding protein [Leifsonia xyli]|uniref:TOMM precursor leader peptide-binding protein n=1 Tax=Leifsonia xyli TaxID=1575 RepID=UPI003D672CA1